MRSLKIMTEKIKTKMVSDNIDLLLIASPANQFYLTGYDGWSFYTPQMVLISLSEEQPFWIGRKMDAVGAKGCILIDECTDPFSYEAVRASMGAIFNINIISINSKEFIEWKKEALFTLIGTSLKNAEDYRKANWDSPFILLMGNEQKGLSDQLIAECDQLIKIPMLGSSDSLNLAVSTGVALYESIRKNPI